MKKTISILAACMLVFAFAGMASAEILTCETDPGHIDRGCETAAEQSSCYTSPFDYEDFYGYYRNCDSPLNSYCESPDKNDLHRALFKICDCITEGIFPEVNEGDVIDISMEILVDKHDGNGPVEGNNGVYWAQDVNQTGVAMETYANQGVACADESCYPENAFVGDFVYSLASSTTTATVPYTGTACDVPENQEIVKFAACTTQTGAHGYTVQASDAVDNKSVWWIDIPYLRVDSNITKGTGWDVYVKICLYTSLDAGGVCGECEGCCYNVKIGTLCCDSTPVVTTCTDTLTFPYFPKTSSYWYGMAVTNKSDEEGEFTVTLYENDGDVFTYTDTVPANSTMVITPDMLTVETSVDGTLGNTQSWAKVVTDFSASGFGMMAKEDNGVSMGYLAERCGSCGGCY